MVLIALGDSSLPGQMGPVVWWHVMIQMMANDEDLAESIRVWVQRELPDDQELVEQMTRLALSYRQSGATVDETCEWIQRFVTSWIRHPSTSRSATRHLHLVGG